LKDETRRAHAERDKALREFEEENGSRKRIVADLLLDKEMLKEVTKRKLWGLS
jgi:hypothetical protein